jgi:hypothetical protein
LGEDDKATKSHKKGILAHQAAETLITVPSIPPVDPWDYFRVLSLNSPLILPIPTSDPIIQDKRRSEHENNASSMHDFVGHSLLGEQRGSKNA